MEKRKRSRWHVGAYWQGNVKRYEAFACYGEPTAEGYPKYSYCIGPFRTRRGAILCASIPRVADTVAGYERVAQRMVDAMVGAEMML